MSASWVLPCIGDFEAQSSPLPCAPTQAPQRVPVAGEDLPDLVSSDESSDSDSSDGSQADFGAAGPDDLELRLAKLKASAVVCPDPLAWVANTNDSMRKAIEHIKSATALDYEGPTRYAEAIQLYGQGIEYFMHIIKYEKNEGKKRILSAQVKKYMERAEVLKTYAAAAAAAVAAAPTQRAARPPRGAWEQDARALASACGMDAAHLIAFVERAQVYGSTANSRQPLVFGIALAPLPWRGKTNRPSPHPSHAQALPRAHRRARSQHT